MEDGVGGREIGARARWGLVLLCFRLPRRGKGLEKEIGSEQRRRFAGDDLSERFVQYPNSNMRKIGSA